MARTKRYYLAYGSNLNVEQMARRCPQARIAGIGEIKDYRLLFKGSKTGSYLTIEQAPGHTVPVAIWEVTAKDEKNLDLYEGFPTFYYKKAFKIECRPVSTQSVKTTGRKHTIDAFAYIMDERRTLGTPSWYYMATCMDGYEAFGFDSTILWEAYTVSKKGEAV